MKGAIASGRRARVLMYIFSLLQGMVFFGPIATLYRQVRGVSIAQIAIIEAVCLMLAIALEIPWGMVADKIGYKKTMVICAVLGVVSKIVFWQAHSFGMFLVERIILAIVIAGMSGVDAAYLSFVSNETDRQKVFGWYDGFAMVGLLGASVIFSVWIQDQYGLAAFLTVVSYFASMLCILALPAVEKDSGTTRQKVGNHVSDILDALKQSKTFLPLLIAFVLIAAVNQTLTVFIVQLRYQEVGMPASVMGCAYILLTLSAVIGAWWSASWTRVLGERLTMIMALSICILSCCILAMGTVWLVIVVAVCLLRLMASILSPLKLTMQTRFSPVAIRATMLSCFAVIANGTEILTNLVFGPLAELQVSYAMIGGALACCIALCLVSCVGKKSEVWRKDSV